ncbi:low temperature requirement protein A [Nocardia cyriacigeorgica]|uniref:low temperature requirement protein A n=1 Tax=Nocardia cyriacigeorgica TaxID=135487 RepID=UPI0010329976|nr:low temperature requirement protein A [Nocardia cyriacigeorgica]MBF6102020.1 low temperature requirement protein A [Nocardia cyriacigeorgica]MBF6160301.1 low temperature requirement protein A [Nocardia cyriacigeorgica]MBF6199386.1 low temperature requirement protein A [Nocardia cyriacigeorgica]MBF6315245.1 low temperature requirement protein A [Nocardia cyriacigeorgica]MBF6343206.1 low temperature requirement protein A [Nocardia cyriacigeorgica]
MIGSNRARLQPTDEGSSVTQLELFFDLVLVFAFTMVTDLAADETTARNLLRALLCLALMWWLWIAYSWLGNIVRADEGIARIAIFVAMGGAFIAALTIPEAFDDLEGGWFGPLVFAIAYLVVRLVHLVMMWLAAEGDPKLRAQILRWALGSITLGTTLLVVAALTDGRVQLALWLAAIAGDWVWTRFAGTEWRLASAKHYSERYGLIIIVALGESIVSIGIGVAGLPISWPITVASMLGLAISGLLWWAYFDVAALSVEHALAHARGARRIKIAQMCYMYWHFPMIAGIIGLSLGLKKVLYYVGDESTHTLSDALYGIPLGAMYGGVALYLVGLVGFKQYATGNLSAARIVTVAVLLALTPVAAALPALASLTMLFAVLAALISWETIRHAGVRDQIRHAVPE